MLWLRIAISVAVPATLIWLSLSGSLPSTGELRSWGEDLGGAAPVAWPFIFAVAAILVPWPFAASATGLVFGTAGGTALAVTGMALVVCAQWAIGHWLAGEELRGWLVARYGNWVSYKPPLQPVTWPLWGAPLLFLGAGAWIAHKRFRKRA